MRKTISITILTILLANIFSVNIFAISDNGTDTQLFINRLQKDYGIDISIEDGYLSQNEALTMIDRVYNKFPVGLIKEVTNYYKTKGYKTHIRFIYKQTNLGGSYGINGKDIHINYYPTAVGHNFGDWAIAHEMGHLIHNYLQDKHGYNTLLNEWLVFNEGYEYNDDWYNATDYEDTFIRQYSTLNSSEDFVTIIEHLIANPKDIKDRISKNSNSNLTKKINYINNLLVKYTTSINDVDNIWSNISIEEPTITTKNTIEEAYTYGLIPSSDSFDGLFTSNITKKKFLEYIVYIIQEDKNLNFRDYVKSIGKKYDYYYNSTVSTIATSDFKEDVKADWTKEHKTEIVYFWVCQKAVTKTDYAFKNAPNFANLLYSLDIVEVNKTGDFNGERLLTREEIAKYIYRMAIATGKELKISEKQYSDINTINAELKVAVDFVVSNNIIPLKDGNRFAPKDLFTYEEAYLAMLNYAKNYMPHKFIKDNQHITDAIYDNASFYSEGVAFVKKDDHYAFVDQSLKEVITLPYKGNISQSYFVNGKAALFIKNANSNECNVAVIIDKSGNELFRVGDNNTYVLDVDHDNQFIKCSNDAYYKDVYYMDFNGNKYNYDNIYFANNFYKTQKTGKYGALNANKKEIIPCSYDNILYVDDILITEKSLKKGAYNLEGKEIIPCVYDYVNVKGNYILTSRNNNGYKETLFDKNGKVIVQEGLYLKIYPNKLDTNYIVVSKNSTDSILDPKGNIVIEKVYLWADDYIILSNKDYTQYSILDCNLNTLFKSDTNLIHMGNGFFQEFKDGRTNILNDKGNIVRSGIDNVSFFSEGYAFVETNNKREIVDTSFNKVVEIDTDKYNINRISGFIKGIAKIYSDEKVGCINTKGKIIVPPIYDGIKEYTNNLFVIKLNGKYGCINSDGTVLFDTEYDEILINNTLISVKKGDLYGLYNYRGYNLLELGNYDKVSPLYSMPLAVIEKTGGFQDNNGKKYGNKVYIDQSGEIYNDVELLNTEDKKLIKTITKTTKTDAIVPYEVNLYGIIDENCNQILETKYSFINVHDDKHLIEVRDKDYLTGYFDYEGNEVIPVKYSDIKLYDDICIASNGLKYGIIGYRGNIISPFKYDAINVDKDKDVIVYKMNNKYGFMKLQK